MTAHEAFYAACGGMMAVGIAVYLVALLVCRFISERVGYAVILFGLACFLMGPLMAAMGPR